MTVTSVSVMVSASNARSPSVRTVKVSSGMCLPVAALCNRSARPGESAKSRISGENVVLPVPPPPPLAWLLIGRQVELIADDIEIAPVTVVG